MTVMHLLSIRGPLFHRVTRTSRVVMLATCGVMRTRGWLHRGEDAGSGSVANTSRSAKPTCAQQTTATRGQAEVHGEAVANKS